MNMNSPKIKEYTLEELTTPKEGYETYVNRWWAVRNGNPIGMCLVSTAKPTGFYGFHYPLCNPNRKVAALLNTKEEPIFIPMAFFPKSPGSDNVCSDRYSANEEEHNDC